VPDREDGWRGSMTAALQPTQHADDERPGRPSIAKVKREPHSNRRNTRMMSEQGNQSGA